ncbi:MAG: hypothetical protein WCK67_03110 [bacterium]
MIVTRYGEGLVNGQKKYFPVIQKEFAKKTGELIPKNTIDTLEGFVKKTVERMPEKLTQETFKTAQETALKNEAAGAQLVAKFKQHVADSIMGLANKFIGKK